MFMYTNWGQNFQDIFSNVFFCFAVLELNLSASAPLLGEYPPTELYPRPKLRTASIFKTTFKLVKARTLKREI